MKQYKTGVINDPFCQTHSLARSVQCFLLFYFARFEKWGRTTCTKTMIPTSRDYGLAEWINNRYTMRKNSFPGRDNVTEHVKRTIKHLALPCEQCRLITPHAISLQIDPLGRPTVTTGSYHCFRTCRPFVRLSVPTFHKTKQCSLLARLWVSGRVDHWWHLSCYSYSKKIMNNVKTHDLRNVLGPKLKPEFERHTKFA